MHSTFKLLIHKHHHAPYKIKEKKNKHVFEISSNCMLDISKKNLPLNISVGPLQK